MKTRTILRPLAGALLILVTVPALLILVLLLEPQRFLTTKTVGRAIQVFASAYQPRWSAFGFEIRSPDIFEKEITVSAADFCFEKADDSLAGCFKSLDARFTFEFDLTGVRVTKISLLDVHGDKLRLDERRSPPKSAAQSAFNPFRLPRLLPAFLRGIRIEKLSVELPSVELAQSSATTTGALRLALDPARADPLALDARWVERGAGAIHRGNARLVCASDLFKSGQLTYADAKGSFEAEGVNADFSAKARQSGADAVALDVKASGRRGGLRFQLHGRGVQNPTLYSLMGTLAVEASTGPLKNLRLEEFHLAAARKAGDALPANLHFDARIRAEPAAFRPIRGFTPPRFMIGKLTVNARASPTFFEKDHFDADLSVVMHPYLSWYEAHAEFFARASGRTSQLPLMQIQPRLEAYIFIARFEDLEAFLAGGPYAVPAPLDALKGGLWSSITARSESMSGPVTFDYLVRGDLAAERQMMKFHIKGGGSVSRLMTENRSIRARAAATLDEVALQLPHLDALKLPTVALDSRIKNSRSKEAVRETEENRRRAVVVGSTSAAELELNLGTSRPIILYTDLAKTPVPVALDLKIERPSGLMTGVVDVKSFGVEFFRRNATVDHLTLTFRPGSKLVGLDGLIKYQATEAMISIRLLGTTEKPQVVFESDPPLSQSDIIAMLVFGKSPDELDADQAVTVANTQTAMSDEAFGLASLYLFASTPIQFVGYDPTTKSYMMKIRIPGGETLQLNSDFDATKSVQLRKRLSRHFAVEAEAINSQTQGNGVVTFLEWFTRY